MSEDFDWQADEEADWDHEKLEAVPKLAGARRRYRNIILFSLVAPVVAAVVVYLLVSRQANRQITDAKLDILAVHNLVMFADQQHDISMITGVLSQYHPDWVKAQKELAGKGLLFGRTSFNMSLPPGSRQTFDLANQDLKAPSEDFIEVVISPDMMTATVTSDLVYRIDYGNQLTDTVTLQHTEFFSRVGNRWLLVPPEAGFWGQWMTIKVGRLSLRYPERDRKITERLAKDIDVILKQMCNSLADIDCPDTLHASITLDPDPGSLATIFDPSISLSGVSPITLPAPTLVGAPVDDAGYQALLRGYASHIVAAIISENVGWRCCEKGLFFQPLLDKQLSQLDLRPWPLTQAEYQALFRYPVSDIARLQHEWKKAPMTLSSHATWRQIYSLIDFILDMNPKISVAILQRHLVSSNDYGSWLARIGLNAVGPTSQNRWLQFVQTKIKNEQPSLPLPDQDIFLLCNSDASDTGDLYRYDLDSGQIDAELTGRAFQFMMPLPGDDGVLLQERPFQFFPPELFLWQSGRELDVVSHITGELLFPIDSSNLDGLLFHSHEVNRDRALYSQLNLERCKTGSCEIQSLQGFSAWSPDGRSTIVASDEGMLWMGNAQGRQLSAIGEGSYPFWIDDDTYGYVGKQPTVAIVVASTLDHKTRSVIPLDTLTAAAYLNLPAEKLSIHSIYVIHDEPNTLLVALNILNGAPNVQDRALIMSYNLATDEASTLLRLEQALTVSQPIRFSPDGRWLAVQSLDRTRTKWQLHLISLQDNKTEVITSVYRFAYPDYDWSANGRFLLRIDRGFLFLLAPDHDYQQVIFHGFSNCFFAAWVSDKVN